MDDQEVYKVLELKFGQRGLKLLLWVGCCGEFPMSLLVRYPGYYDYNRRIVTSLVREGYLKERKFRDYDNHVVRSLSLTKKGIEHIQAESPAHAELILSHELSPASGQGDWKKTLRLHRSAACFLAAHQAGAYWNPGEEKDVRSRTQLTYYGAYEFHTRYPLWNGQQGFQSFRHYGEMEQDLCSVLPGRSQYALGRSIGGVFSGSGTILADWTGTVFRREYPDRQ